MKTKSDHTDARRNAEQKEKTVKKLFFTIVVALLSGCTVNPSQVPADYAKEFVSKATYVQDARTGLCYSIVSMRMTMSANQNGISFTWVPCEKAEPFLVK